MISDVPLRPEFGGGRPQFELACALRGLGHEVATFDAIDAFGHDRGSPLLSRFAVRRFIRRAARHVREHGGRFDVVDANQGNLPFDRAELGLRGLLVARSSGLFAFYRDYARYEQARWPELLPGSRAGQLLHRWRTGRGFALEERSLERCDLAILPNREEAAYVRLVLRPEGPCAMIPLTLPSGHTQVMAAAALPPQERLDQKRVVCIGSWCLRKGAADWPRVISVVRRLVPESSFRFLGTGVSEQVVVRELGPEANRGVSVVPHYDAADLPSFLGDSTVGALPSYVEAGPLSILETLGAALPTVAYDAPGSRELVPASEWLVSLGDADAFGERLARLLQADVADYATAAERARASVLGYDWTAAAARTVEAYESTLAARQ